MSTEYVLRCKGDGETFDLGLQVLDPIEAFIALWPAVKAILDSGSIWMSYELPRSLGHLPEEEFFAFLRAHEGHEIEYIDELGKFVASGGVIPSTLHEGT